MPFETPQDKIRAQSAQVNPKVSESQGQINSDHKQRPMDSSPGNPQKPQVDLNNMGTVPPQQVDAGPEQGVQTIGESEDGFIVRYLKQKAMNYILNKFDTGEGVERPDSTLENQELSSKSQPQQPRAHEPEPKIPEPKRPQPTPPKAVTPPIQTPRVQVPKFGKLPRIL